MKPTILQGHTRPIKSIDFSSDATQVFSASNDRTIVCWNIEKKEKEKTFLHVAAINCFILSACGKYLISGDNTATIYIWDIEKNFIITSIEGNPSESVKSIYLNESSEVLLIAFAGRGKTAPSKIKSFAFKPLVFPEKQSNGHTNGHPKNDGKGGVIYNDFSSGNEKPTLYDMNQEKNDGLKNDKYSSQSIYSNSNSNTPTNKSSKKEKKGKQQSQPVEPVLNTRKLLLTEIPPLSEFNSCKSKFVKAVFIQNDKYILVGKEDGSVELLNGNTGEVLLEKQVHPEAILDIDVCENLRFILTSSSDGYCILLSLDSFDILYKFHPENPTRNINSCRLMLIDNPFVPKKKLDVDELFSNNKDEVELLEDKYLKLRKNDKLPIAVFSGGQDSKIVTTTHKSEGGFEIFAHELITGSELLNFTSHFGPVNALGCTMKSVVLASGSEDATVRLYNIEEYIKALEQ